MHHMIATSKEIETLSSDMKAAHKVSIPSTKINLSLSSKQFETTWTGQLWSLLLLMETSELYTFCVCFCYITYLPSPKQWHFLLSLSPQLLLSSVKSVLVTSGAVETQAMRPILQLGIMAWVLFLRKDLL